MMRDEDIRTRRRVRSASDSCSAQTESRKRASMEGWCGKQSARPGKREQSSEAGGLIAERSARQGREKCRSSRGSTDCECIERHTM
jgi:hypothetical protein